MSYIASELRRSRLEDARLARRLALSNVEGEVVSVDGSGRVRLKLGEDPGSGEAVLSPPVRVASIGSGRVKVSTRPSVGERMRLHSASGVVGADSYATRAPFNNDHPDPGSDEWPKVIQVGKASIRVKEDRIEIAVDDAKLVMEASLISARIGDSRVVVRKTFVKLRKRDRWVVVTDDAILTMPEPVSGPDPDPSV